MRSRSTTAGATSQTRPCSSSNASCEAPIDDPQAAIIAPENRAVIFLVVALTPGSEHGVRVRQRGRSVSAPKRTAETDQSSLVHQGWPPSIAGLTDDASGLGRVQTARN